MHYLLKLVLFVVLVVFLLKSKGENHTTGSSSYTSSQSDESEPQLEFPSGLSYSSQSSERLLAMMKADFGQYLQRLPFFFQKYDAFLSQAARMALYWNRIDDLHSYFQESQDTLIERQFSFPPPASLYSHYAVHISTEACRKLDLMEWIEVGGTASGLVNSLTPLPLGILYKNTTSKLKPHVSKKLLRGYEKKLAIFSTCYSAFFLTTNFAMVSRPFFSFSELDAPLLSGFKLSTLIQLSDSFPLEVTRFLMSNNEFVQSWLPRDFWRSIQGGYPRNGSDFTIVNNWVRNHYHDLENSFFAKGIRSDTLLQARRTCFILHRALSSYVWEVDKFPRYPSEYSLKFISLLEKIVIEEVFLKFGVLPSPEEIETSPELAFKVIGLLNGAECHFANFLIRGPLLVNLKRADLPALEPVLSRIGVEKTTMIPGWPYLLEKLGVSLNSFSWKSIPEDWFSSLTPENLYPLYDGGSWYLVRMIKSIFTPNWKTFQRTHLFSFISTESFFLIGPVQQLNLLIHPDAGKHLSPEVFGSLNIDRFRLLYEHAASKGILPQFKQATRKYYSQYILALEEELDTLKVQLEGIDTLDTPFIQKISKLQLQTF